MRIDKFLTECGIATRKEAALVAKKGGILVDGAVEKNTARHINPEVNRVTYLGEALEYKEFVYVLLNKPEGYVSATEDAKLPVVTELLPERLQKRGLFPVGRLDKDTLGLMILTNNGALAHTLLSPRHHVEKEYYFEAAEPLPLGVEEQFATGVILGDGYECKSAKITLSENRQAGHIVLTEGKYHQIKRMIASFDNKVVHLERVRFGKITSENLPRRGEWRYLTDEEENSLIQSAKEG